MTSDSLYQVGGLGLVLGAVLLAVGVFVHPVPEAAVAGGSETAAHWLFAVGLTLLLAGILALSRHFGGTAAEGLGILALAVAIVSYGALVSSWGVEAAALAAGEDAAAALGTGAEAQVEMGRVLAWLGLVPLGLAMLRDTGWSRGLAMAGVALGILLAAGEFVIAEYSILRTAFLVGFVWLAVVGWSFRGMGAPAPAAAPARDPGAPAAGSGY